MELWIFSVKTGKWWAREFTVLDLQRITEDLHRIKIGLHGNAQDYIEIHRNVWDYKIHGNT